MTSTSLVAHDYEAVIGLEVHCQLALDSKLFCGVSRSGIDEVTLALPGTLPVLNERAVDLGILLGLALGCQVHSVSLFARKNYFYPDLPKGYQITQFDRPLCTGGGVLLSSGTFVSLDRIQIEEDAGKTVHGQGKSLVDFSRAGVGLLEIVSNPDLRSATEAAEYLRKLHRLVVFYGVSDGDMEKGNFRADANVSIRRRGASELGTRTELKNINSFRFLERAIVLEIERQIAIVEDGGAIIMETRGYDANSDRTFRMRTKESAHDYRYFPDPDLPPIVVGPERLMRAQSLFAGDPQQSAKRLVDQIGLSCDDAELLTRTHPSLLFYEGLCAALVTPSKKAAGSFLASILIAAEPYVMQWQRNDRVQIWFAAALDAVAEGKISLKVLKDYWLEALTETAAAQSFWDWSVSRGYQSVSDQAAIAELVNALIAEFPSQAAELQAGKEKVMSFFVGQAMKRTKGAVNVQAFGDTLRRSLGLSLDLN
jgi:aspartyl-tRNA(Asn)/glutamyl-tRNA(Gln) amidotransferase subunit B